MRLVIPALIAAALGMAAMIWLADSAGQGCHLVPAGAVKTSLDHRM